MAMAYVQPGFADIGTDLVADVRGKPVTCSVSELPFVAPNFRRSHP